MRENFLALVVMLFLCVNLSAQEDTLKNEPAYRFTPIIDLPTTPIKDQYKSGTCWSYSSLSFIETEMIRMGQPQVDLSEMFVVWESYAEKARKYVRMHGKTNFGEGGAFHDAMWVLKNYGMVPDSVYNGLVIGEKKPIHGEMDEVLKNFLDGVLKNENKKLSPVWMNAFKDILNSYLGVIPETFTYRGKKYTPQSFSSEYMKINPDDYVEIGSYTHHPFYQKFILEVPDNWLWDEIYNVPMDELTEIIDQALANGYTVAWGADVSDRGFATKKKGVAVVPEVNLTDMNGTELSRWEKMDEKEQDDELYKLDKPGKEKTITQEMRQADFDNYSTTDDHGMHIVGTAKDQNGTVYYKVKNSWGDYNDFNGYFYASKPYVALRTIDIMINKNAIPKKIKNKLGIE
ncbi:MAG TPA: C1 family peptidase [Prolixibacteraceae bacterium]|nr:C1 family peptidase [Prolixibacteraceae bacterium]